MVTVRIFILVCVCFVFIQKVCLPLQGPAVPFLENYSKMQHIITMQFLVTLLFNTSHIPFSDTEQSLRIKFCVVHSNVTEFYRITPSGVLRQ